MIESFSPARRLCGITIPSKKLIEYSIRYVKGIGAYRAKIICQHFNFLPTMRAYQLTDEITKAIEAYIVSNKWLVEYDLLKDHRECILRKVSLQSYQGKRHQLHLPIRSCRTQRNCRNSKRVDRYNTKKGRSL